MEIPLEKNEKVSSQTLYSTVRHAIAQAYRKGGYLAQCSADIRAFQKKEGKCYLSFEAFK